MKFKVKIAYTSIAKQITALRIDAYKNGSNSTIQDFSFLNWSQQDEESIILYVENEVGEMISSMRAIYTTNIEDIEEIFDIRINVPIQTPVLLFDKLITNVQCRGTGISRIFRYLFLHYSIDSSVQHILFTVNDGVSRIPLLKKSGFEFEKADISHRAHSVYKNSTAVLLAKLPTTKFAFAAQCTLDNFKTPLTDYSIDPQVTQEIQQYLNPVIAPSI